ncbi:CRE-SRJ-32 protein [Caenorhabditis remanei]|uniref:CRE-SRJ-32 protein n=1 Tax=Caenorhabditis remanei TaxID=31234 RepID=E3LJU6_CAERE|nr:CRE-SRJ-32 protein [Caenorhabditis remanei]
MHLIPNCFLLLFLIKTSESKVKVNLMTGTLVHNLNCDDLSKSLDDLSQNEVLSCAALCGNNETCEVFYWKQETCFICPYGNVKTVEINEDGFPIGIKSQPEDESVCPTSNITLPVRLSTFSNYSSTSPHFNFSSLVSSTTIPLKTTSRLTTKIEVSETLSTITKDQGIELCEKVGGRITGPNTIQERDFLRDTTTQIFGNRLSPYGVGVWIDGSRTEECDGGNAIFISTCSNITVSFLPLTKWAGSQWALDMRPTYIIRKLIAFTFSDSTLKDRFGYIFIPGQPDGAYSSQNCLQLMVTTNNINGLVDDLHIYCKSIFRLSNIHGEGQLGKLSIFVLIFRTFQHISFIDGHFCAYRKFVVVTKVCKRYIFQGVHGFRYCFLIFLSDGWLFKQSELGMFLLALRCSLIGCTYAVLISHFVYRYLTVKGSSLTQKYFPIYMIASFFLCAFFSIFWIGIAYIVAVPNLETRKYIQEDFLELYEADPLKLNFFALMYKEAPLEILIKSWFGAIAGTTVSVGSISIFMTFSYLIMKNLKQKQLGMSEKTAKLQRELFRALIVQTAVPICLSFAPCMLSWYTPMFNMKLGKWLNYTGAVPLSAFPFIDPLAVILCLPGLRKRIFGKGKARISSLAVIGINKLF